MAFFKKRSVPGIKCITDRIKVGSRLQGCWPIGKDRKLSVCMCGPVPHVKDPHGSNPRKSMDKGFRGRIIRNYIDMGSVAPSVCRKYIERGVPRAQPH